MFLRSDIELSVEYWDRTRFGSPVGGRPDDLARKVFHPLARWAEFGGTLEPSVTAAVRSGSLYNALTHPDGSLCDELLYPLANDAWPRFLAFGDSLRLEVASELWPHVHELLSGLSNGGLTREAIAHPDATFLFDALEESGMLTDHHRNTPCAPTDVTFVGHNTVVLRDLDTTIVVDPFLSPTSSRYPLHYQPLGLNDIGALDAVLITHGHRDHFDPASLLRIPPNTTIFVPDVERENLLTVDMAHRLAELGFTDVRRLRPDDAATIGSITVRAMPFYGEQPSDGPRLHPEVRNVGCTYHVRTSEWSCVLLADSGTDQNGCVKDVATKYRRRLGNVDVVFSGYRGWATYPPQLLGSSVARYLFFVEPDQWTVLNRLMSSVDDALDVAERWGARYLCPYGDGGAPWYWERGLGPRLDGGGRENASFDPFPERVVEAAKARSATVDGRLIPTSVDVLLLRPGQGVDGIASAPKRTESPWPYSSEVASC